MIYCVEDEQNICELEVYTLQSVGLDAKGCSTGKELFEELENKLPQLILLDIMLPDEDGITVLKKLKNDPILAQIPVIMATAKSMEFDKVIGLDAGADDYLAKPFGMMEMVSRVKAVLRRTNRTAAPGVLKHKDLELNAAFHRVSRQGKPIDLTVKEYELLRLFLENPGQVFTRENLLSAIWESEYQGETRTVDVHIASLRTKLGEAGSYIKTVRGVGYCLESET